jgi:hypothetical protein
MDVGARYVYAASAGTSLPGTPAPEIRNNRNCSDNSICIIHQSKEHKILAEMFKIEENICLNLQNLSMNLYNS